MHPHPHKELLYDWRCLYVYTFADIAMSSMDCCLHSIFPTAASMWTSLLLLQCNAYAICMHACIMHMHEGGQTILIAVGEIMKGLHSWTIHGLVRPSARTPPSPRFADCSALGAISPMISEHEVKIKYGILWWFYNQKDSPFYLQLFHTKEKYYITYVWCIFIFNMHTMKIWMVFFSQKKRQNNNKKK